MFVGKRQSIIGSLIVSVIRRSGASGISLEETNIFLSARMIFHHTYVYICGIDILVVIAVTHRKLTSPNS